jgi:CDP-glucose 4,6-dehydratase
VISPGFWRDRPVLVTGHTGFKGSWLCWWLQQLGARTTGLALDPPTAPSLYEASGLAQAMVSLRGDVRDAGLLARVLREHRPEVVFHLAAQSLVRESLRNPLDTFSTNVMGTAACLEAARGCDSVRAVVVVTTDKCYRNLGTARGYREDDQLGGEDPYSASKACAELVTEAYRKSFFEAPGAAGTARVASARAGNVIGGGDWAVDRLVPDAMRAFAARRAVPIRNPQATRPWQHVLEPLHGYLVLAERLHAGSEEAAAAWNFGPDPGDSRPVSWVADQLAQRWGGGARWERDGTRQPREAALLALDSSKAHGKLGWRMALPLEQALDWVVEWYRDFSARGARAVTSEQITRFQAALSSRSL